MHKRLINKLNEVGLNERQATIYLELLESGQLRIRDLVLSTSIARSTIYEDLSTLKKLGLIDEITFEHHRKFEANSLSELGQSMSLQIIRLEKQLVKVEHLDSVTSEILTANNSNSVTVKYFENRSGAQQLLWNTLKATTPVLVYSQWRRSKFVGQSFYQRFVEESKSRKIHESVIINPTKDTLEDIKSNLNTELSRTKLENIRCIEKKALSVVGETFIYDDTYAQIFLTNKLISGFVIESSQFADTQRALFEQIWKNAQHINEFF